jgi:hypothetical protein
LQASVFVGHFIYFGEVFDLDDGGHAFGGAVACNNLTRLDFFSLVIFSV